MYVGRVAVYFLIVEGEMLHASRYTIFLYFLDIGHYHTAREERVFAHVFEVTAIEGCAVDIYAWAE